MFRYRIDCFILCEALCSVKQRCSRPQPALSLCRRDLEHTTKSRHVPDFRLRTIRHPLHRSFSALRVLMPRYVSTLRVAIRVVARSGSFSPSIKVDEDVDKPRRSGSAVVAVVGSREAGAKDRARNAGAIRVDAARMADARRQTCCRPSRSCASGRAKVMS